MPDFEFTITLVRHAFGGLKDASGSPLADHCLRVAGYVQPQFEAYIQVALLHDIVEDTYVDLEYLEACGYPPEVLTAVDLLTHRKKEMSYAEYIDQICASGNPIAIAVKLADQRDNLDPKRWVYLSKYQSNALRKRYSGVQDKLQEALQHAA